MSSVLPVQQFLHPWYGIRTRSNQERIAAAVLRDKGYEPFLPVHKVRRRWSDRVVTTELPLFPGYLFCRFDHSQRGPIITSLCVVSIVGCGDQPAPVPDEQINAVRTIVDSDIAAESTPFLREGQRIRVTHGPLKSVEGTLVRKKSGWRLLICIDLLQRSVSVEIDPAHVEAV
jgi:transcription antitermination factor NusG